MIAAAWVGVVCWIDYPFTYLGAFRWSHPFYTADDDCSESLAKWPDGRKFSTFDWFPGYADDTEHNRWLAAVNKKIVDCRAAKPFGERLAFFLTNTWGVMKEIFPLMLLPPLALLLAGLIVSWILKGFRSAI